MLIPNQPICNFLYENLQPIAPNFSFSNRVRMSWNIGEKKLFLQLKSKIALYHVALTTQKNSIEKHTLTVVDKEFLTGH